MKLKSYFKMMCSVSLMMILLLNADFCIAQENNDDQDRNATFFTAIADGDNETLKTMLTEDASLLTINNSRGSTPLMVAASVGQTEAVKILIDAGSEIGASNPYGNTALHYAAWAGDLESFKLLYDQGADLFFKNSRENTPVEYTCLGGNYEILQYVENKSMEAKDKIDSDSTLILWAANGGNIEMFEYFIDKGFDISLVDDDGSTILFWAVAGNNIDMIDYLVKKKGMDVNAVDHNGERPMNSAINWKRPEAVRYLLENGVDANEKLEDHVTWLHEAAHAGTPEIMTIFIEQGADVNAANDNGARPLNWASGSGDIEKVSLLLEHGAKVNPGICERSGCNDDMFTPLHSAAWRSPTILELLIEKGADVNAVSKDGTSALHNACRGDSSRCVEILSSKGGNVNIANKRGITPLHYAVINGNPESMAILIKAGADINTADNSHNTPLHYASTGGYHELVDILIKNNAKLNIKNGEGKTPVYLAAYYGNTKIADILIEKGASKKDLPKKNLYISGFKPSDGEAMIWYTGHSGWTVKTSNHLLIFDYWHRGDQPDQVCMNNGWVNPDEIKTENVYVFVSHSHRDHYDQRIFEWNDELDNITYVMGFEATFPVDYNYIEPRNQKKVGDIKVTTIESNDSGEGFIVEVDGLTIFHPGDHANKNDQMTDDYKLEIDYLAENYDAVDFAFFPISGCGFRNKEAVFGGVYYAIEQLHPKMVLPMHGLSREYEYQEFADQAKEKKYPVKFACAQNMGDRFYYNQHKITAAK